MSLLPLPGRPSSGHPLASRWGLPAIPLLLLAGCAGAAPASPAPAQALRDALTLEREIRAGESHTYPVVLETGQFLRVVVDQNGVDVVVRLVDPEGNPVLDVDSPNGKEGDEDFAAVARTAGLHRIEIVPGGEGRYALKVEGPRRPDDRDRLRVEAVRATREALTAGGEEPEQRARFEKALALWQDLGELRRQAEMLYLLGVTLSPLGQPERAAEVFTAAARLWGKLGDRGMGDLTSQVEALNDAGLLHRQLAEWDAAQERFEQALRIAVTTEDLEQQASVLHNLGLLARLRGAPRAGIEPLRRSIDLARRIGDRTLEAKALNSLGTTFMDLSERQRALDSFQEARAICQEVGDREVESSVLTNLGGAYESLGEREKALALYDDSLRRHRERGDQAGEVAALNNLALVYQRLGETEKALESFGRALALARAMNARRLQARILANRGFVRLLRGEAEEARQDSIAALDLAGSGGGIEPLARHALGSAYRLLGRHEAARAELERALELSRSTGNQSRVAEVILTLARLEKDRGDLTRALSLVQESVRIIESLRASVVSQDLRASFLASKQVHYELQIDILMALHASQPDEGHVAEALRVSEQARARSLLEILQEGGADIRQGAPSDLLERERLLRAKVGALELQRLALRGEDKAATPERLAEAERKLDESLEAYGEVQAKLRESSPHYVALTQPRPLEVAEIQARVLDGGALLLEYALGAERSYLWAVTPESVEGFTLPARHRIEGLASRYYGLLTSRARIPPAKAGPLDAEAEQVGAELAEIVLGPVRHLLRDQPLLVVSDGALQYIPFSALPVPGTTRLLIQKHKVVNLPSASVLDVHRAEIRDRPAAPLTLAVLADPVFQEDDDRLARLPRPGDDVADRSFTSRGMETGLGAERESEADLESFLRLRHSKREADEIVSLLPADQTFKAVGLDASRATALSGRLAEYRNVHFATHGLVRSDHPGLSSLVLSLYDEKGEPVDGFLRLNDIYNLELRADLVVLSACRTALGKEIRGEGLIGLTRGFMYAGASRVLATLWSVDDRATADFMKHFYRAMLNGKLSPAEAVRQAQLAMMARPNRKAPYFWAGFSLQGEWK